MEKKNERNIKHNISKFPKKLLIEKEEFSCIDLIL